MEGHKHSHGHAHGHSHSHKHMDSKMENFDESIKHFENEDRMKRLKVGEYAFPSAVKHRFECNDCYLSCYVSYMGV